MHLGSGLDIQSIIFGDRLATAAGLRGGNTINNFLNVAAVIHRIIREGCSCDTIQNFTISIPSIGVVLVADTRSGRDSNSSSLTVANGIRQGDFNNDFRNRRNFNGSGVETSTISTVGTVAFHFGNHFVFTS